VIGRLCCNRRERFVIRVHDAALFADCTR
jgi:hypothetical protein